MPYWKLYIILISCLIATAVFLSVVGAMPSLYAAASGIENESEISLVKYLREGAVGLLLLLTLSYARDARYNHVIIGVVGYLAFICIVRIDYASQVGFLASIRIVLFWAAAISVASICRIDWDYSCRILRKIVKIYLIVTAIACIYQIRYFPPSSGATFLGSRAYGLLGNPIAASQTVAAASMLILVCGKDRAEKLIWLAACLALSATTGGRAGMLALIAVGSSYYVSSAKMNASLKTTFHFGMIGVMPLAFKLLSSELISGREGTASGLRDGRLDAWQMLISRYVLDSWQSLLFGFAPGMGSNSLVSTYANDPNAVPFRPAIADSSFITMILSFGLVGITIFLAIICYVFIYRVKIYKMPLFLGMFVLMTALNVSEISPANIFLASAVGAACVGGQIRTRSRKDARRVHTVGSIAS